jgi:hypothetical protein
MTIETTEATQEQEMLQQSADLFRVIGESTGANRAVHASCVFGAVRIRLLLNGKMDTAEGGNILTAVGALVAAADQEDYEDLWSALKPKIEEAGLL